MNVNCDKMFHCVTIHLNAKPCVYEAGLRLRVQNGIAISETRVQHV